jgi:uncharacterized protein with ParB-like and HNH nuclease domain
VTFDKEGERHYKLLLSQTDKSSLIAVVGGTPQPPEPSLRVMNNFAFFESRIAERKGDLAPVCKGLAKLMVVDLALSRDQDNPQLIFESMNSTGRELSQADLIRNFILMGLEPQMQTKLYEEYWRPIEVDFGQEAYDTHFDAFMRHYLTVKTGEIPRLDEVYEVGRPGFDGGSVSWRIVSSKEGVSATCRDHRSIRRSSASVPCAWRVSRRARSARQRVTSACTPRPCASGYARTRRTTAAAPTGWRAPSARS